jgi:hypothetical protein
MKLDSVHTNGCACMHTLTRIHVCRRTRKSYVRLHEGYVCIHFVHLCSTVGIPTQTIHECMCIYSHNKLCMFLQVVHHRETWGGPKLTLRDIYVHEHLLRSLSTLIFPTSLCVDASYVSQVRQMFSAHEWCLDTCSDGRLCSPLHGFSIASSLYRICTKMEMKGILAQTCYEFFCLVVASQLLLQTGLDWVHQGK